jgi:hypothetical protein
MAIPGVETALPQEGAVSDDGQKISASICIGNSSASIYMQISPPLYTLQTPPLPYTFANARLHFNVDQLMKVHKSSQ